MTVIQRLNFTHQLVINYKQNMQKLQVQQDSSTILKLQRGSIFFLILNFCVTTACIGLFTASIVIFLPRMNDVIDGTSFGRVTETDSCNFYYCDQTQNYVIYANSFFQKCNTQICQNVVCSGYNCNQAIKDPNDYYQSVSAYYSCFNLCENIQTAQTPSYIFIGFAIGIAMSATFYLAFVLGLVYGIIYVIKFSEATIQMKIAMAFTCLCPVAKYFIIRNNQDWKNYYINTKMMLVVDIIITILVGISFGLSTAMFSMGYWVLTIQIVAYFYLLWSYFLYISILIRNSRIMWNMKNLQVALIQQKMVIF